MKKQIIIFIFCVGIFFSFSYANAATYYISSSTGNDNNTGLDKNHPWAHAPGMAAATGNPARYAQPNSCSAVGGTCTDNFSIDDTQLFGQWQTTPPYNDPKYIQFSVCNPLVYCVFNNQTIQNNINNGTLANVSLPGDKFIFKGCDVWTGENYPWQIAEQRMVDGSHGSYFSAPIDGLGTGRSNAKISFFGDEDKTWYNNTKCPSGWNRPVLDACRVEAPPISSPYQAGDLITSCSGNNLMTYPVTTASNGVKLTEPMINFPIKNVLFSGFDIRNIYVPNQSGYTAYVYNGNQATAWLTFRNNYIHAWYADPPVEVMATVEPGSDVVHIISGDTSKIQDGMAFQIAGTYKVFPPADNGPMVASWNSETKTLNVRDSNGPVYACGLNGSGGCSGGGVDCRNAPGCLLVGGSQGMAVSPIQGYPSGRDITFENNVVDGHDSNLVQEDYNCPNDVWGKCMGVNGGMYQGPQIVRNNVFRDTSSWYAGGVQEFNGNYLIGPHRVDVNTTAHDNVMESLGDYGFGAIVANNVIVGAKAGMHIAFNPRKKHISTASVVQNSSIIHFSSDPATACGSSATQLGCEMHPGWALKVVGGGSNGKDLDTYVYAINGNDVTLEDPAQKTDAQATIYTGGVNPSYAFNNVVSDISLNGDVFQIYSWGNQYGSAYIFNNTVEGGTDPNGYYKDNIKPIMYGSGCPPEMEHCEYRNNLLLACAGDGQGSADCNTGRPFARPGYCGTNCTQSANVSQGLNQATTQGSVWNQKPYTFFPSSQSPVIGAGENLTAYCSKPRLAGLCSDTSYAVGYDEVNHQVISGVRTVSARPTTGAWDAGAYQYNSTPSCTIKGDFTCNGYSISDLQTMISIILGTDTTTSRTQADMNNDTLVNISDLQLLINKVLGIN